MLSLRWYDVYETEAQKFEVDNNLIGNVLIVMFPYSILSGAEIRFDDWVLSLHVL